MAHCRLAIKEDAYSLAPRMRQADINEIKASHGVKPLDALLEPFNSYYTGTAYSIISDIDDIVIGMFGSRSTDDSNYGCAWLLSSEELRTQSHKKQFLKQCRKWGNKINKPFRFIYNYVDARNWQSLKWLKFCGFEIITTEKYGLENIDFHLLVRDSKNV